MRRPVVPTLKIRLFIRRRRLRVLTFVGYSGAGYAHPAVLQRQARRVLAQHDAATTVVNIGATAAGIGVLYALAKQLGFRTMGIVSTQAQAAGLPLSPAVDKVFWIADAAWGGVLPASRRLSPTSAAMVACSDVMVAIGGGVVARDELSWMHRCGKPALFFPAEMNHATALAKAAGSGARAPVDFRGAAHRLRHLRGMRQVQRLQHMQQLQQRQHSPPAKPNGLSQRRHRRRAGLHALPTLL